MKRKMRYLILNLVLILLLSSCYPYMNDQVLKEWPKYVPPQGTQVSFVTLCLLVLSQVPIWFQRFLYIAGGLFILYLAYGAYKAWKNFNSNIPVGDLGTGQSLWKAAMMNALSPGPYIFWSLVTGPILIRGWRETPMHGIGFMAGFYLTFISALGLIIIVFGVTRELGPKVNRALIGLSAIALFCFGLYQLWLGIVA